MEANVSGVALLFDGRQQIDTNKLMSNTGGRAFRPIVSVEHFGSAHLSPFALYIKTDDA